MKSPRAPAWSLGGLTLLYLALPLPIFFFGWFKPVYAVLAAAPVVFCGGYLIRLWPAEPLTVSRKDLSFLAIFSLALTILMGIAGFVPQTGDWIKHNAVLFDTVNLPWPVVIDDGSTRWMLTYYLAFYLPAAVIGKLAGYMAAQTALWLWTCAGVMLGCLWFARLTRLPLRLASFVLFSLSGLDFAANILTQVLNLTNHPGHLNLYPNQAWAQIWVFPNFFVALECAPGQSLAGWLAAGLFLTCPRPLRPVCLAFLFICGLLWSPFAAAGVVLWGVFLLWREGWEWSLKPLVPMLGLLLPAAALVGYYAAKMSPDVAARFPAIPIAFFTQFHDGPGPLKSVILLFLFSAAEFAIFLWFIRRRFPRGTSERHLADACALTFVCLLPVTMGYYSDLSMRASSSALFGLALLIVRAIGPGGLEPKMRRWLALFLLIGFLTPLIEASHQAYHLAMRRYDPRFTPHQLPAIAHMGDGGYKTFGAQYVGSTNSFFARTLAR